MEKEYLLLNEICDEYRVTLVYVRKVVSSHIVKAKKHGRNYIVKRSDWENFFNSKED